MFVTPLTQNRSPSLSQPAHIALRSSLPEITSFLLFCNVMSTSSGPWFFTKYSCRLCQGRALITEDKHDGLFVYMYDGGCSL